jgi:hypothetical protein
MAVLAMVAALLAATPLAQAAARKPKVHTVFLGAAKHVPYSKVGDPAGADSGEKSLKIRPLVVDDLVKEWTSGEAHDVTERSFVVRRAIRLNDTLPGERQERWVWQRGPWLLVNRVNGHILALKLPDYDPGVSQVKWFRDYGAYCGLNANGKSLYALVAQVEAHKPVLAKKLAAFDPGNHPEPVCGAVEWQREPLRVTFHPIGKEEASFEIVPGSAVLVEETGDEQENSAAEAKKNRESGIGIRK